MDPELRPPLVAISSVHDTAHTFTSYGSRKGSDIHVMLALYSCFGQIVVANEILDGADMIGEGLGKRPCTAYQT